MSILTWVKREPAVLITLASAGVAAGAVMGFHLNPTETKEVYSVSATVAALLVRHTVTPTSRTGTSIAALEARIAALEPVVNALVPAAVLPEVKVLEEALAATAPTTATPEVLPARPVGVTRSPTPSPAQRWTLMG